MRSVNKGILDLDGVEIPVRVYTAFKPFEFSGNLYHADCGERIRSPYKCPVHEDEETIVTFSAIQVANKLVHVSPELRDNLLGRKESISIISSHPIKDISTMLMAGTMPVANYFVLPDGHDDIRSTNVRNFSALMNKLKQRNRFLLVKFGAGGLIRYGILLPNFRLMALSYIEEQVDIPDLDVPAPNSVNGFMLRQIDNLSADTPFVFSLANIARRVSIWLDSHLPVPKRTSKKKRSKITVDA